MDGKPVKYKAIGRIGDNLQTVIDEYESENEGK